MTESLSPDTHPTRRLAVPPVHLELPEMWRSFSDGAKERQETGAGLRHRYLVFEIRGVDVKNPSE